MFLWLAFFFKKKLINMGNVALGLCYAKEWNRMNRGIKMGNVIRKKSTFRDISGYKLLGDFAWIAFDCIPWALLRKGNFRYGWK